MGPLIERCEEASKNLRPGKHCLCSLTCRLPFLPAISVVNLRSTLFGANMRSGTTGHRFTKLVSLLLTAAIEKRGVGEREKNRSFDTDAKLMLLLFLRSPVLLTPDYMTTDRRNLKYTAAVFDFYHLNCCIKNY